MSERDGTSDSVGVDPDAAVNPFLVPGWEEYPLRPLCPWLHAEHAEYYVDVNHTQQAFAEFSEHMSNPSVLIEDGRLVLVTGESGCGKTALINRCAQHIVDRLAAHQLNGVIIDLSREGGRGERQSIDDRMAIVCERLLDELRHRGLLSDRAVDELRDSWNRPSRVYPNLGNYLDDAIVTIVLLPPVDELIAEVSRYVGLARRRLLLFVESAHLDEEDVRTLISQPAPPVWLRVGHLNEGDVSRFIIDRLERHDRGGRYPRIARETMEQAAGPLRSVAMLQRILSGVYEDRRRRAVNYTSGDWVTYEDITKYFYEEFLTGMRIRP